MPENVKLGIARALVGIGAVGVSRAKPIIFKSGIVSPVYVDNRALAFHPVEWRLVIEGFKSLIVRDKINFDVIASVAVGGVPHGSALAYALQKPCVFIRKEAKEHGKQKRVEGGEIAGLNVLMIEDLVTSGGSSLSALQALRDEGGIARHILAIVAYGFPEAVQAFAKADAELTSLTDFPTILQAGTAMGRFSAHDKLAVEDWLADPHGWGKRHGFS